MYDSYGLTGFGLCVWIVVALALIGGLIGGLFASGVISSKDFECPKGQHAYVEYYQPMPVWVGKTVVITEQPVYGCEAGQ